MKYLSLIIVLVFTFCGKKFINNYKTFDEKQKTISEGMTFRKVSNIIGNPTHVYLNDSIIIGNYDYGNIEGYRFIVGFSKDSIVLCKEYEN